MQQALLTQVTWGEAAVLVSSISVCTHQLTVDAHAYQSVKTPTRFPRVIRYSLPIAPGWGTSKRKSLYMCCTRPSNVSPPGTNKEIGPLGSTDGFALLALALAIALILTMCMGMISL